MDLTGAMRPTVQPQVASIELDGELVLYDERDHRLHQLGGVGSVIWPFLDGRTSLDELVVDLAAAFEVPEAQVRADLTELLQALAAEGLVAVDGVVDRELPVADDQRAAPTYLVDPPAP